MSDAGEELDGRPDPEPGDNTTLTAVLEGYATEGFTEQFEVDASNAAPALRCAACGETSRADEVSMHSLRRLEGASDPDDMMGVAAITCPRCQVRGVLVLGYGPMASVEDSDVLRALRDERGDDVAPQSSAPGETTTDDV